MMRYQAPEISVTCGMLMKVKLKAYLVYAKKFYGVLKISVTVLNVVMMRLTKIHLLTLVKALQVNIAVDRVRMFMME